MTLIDRISNNFYQFWSYHNLKSIIQASRFRSFALCSLAMVLHTKMSDLSYLNLHKEKNIIQYEVKSDIWAIYSKRVLPKWGLLGVKPRNLPTFGPYPMMICRQMHWKIKWFSLKNCCETKIWRQGKSFCWNTASKSS